MARDQMAKELRRPMIYSNRKEKTNWVGRKIQIRGERKGKKRTRESNLLRIGGGARSDKKSGVAEVLGGGPRGV